MKQLIAGLLGDLAKIDHKQKLRRIRSGIAAAQDAGKWTGRPPAGFDVEDGYLRVNPAEYLHAREALARVDRGEPYADVAEETGLPEPTLRGLEEDRRVLYLAGEADDDRVDAALKDVRPLDDGVIALPANLQKDYPTDRTPSYTEIELADETIRTLRMYLGGRWKDSEALWPSRQSDRMTA